MKLKIKVLVLGVTETAIDTLTAYLILSPDVQVIGSGVIDDEVFNKLLSSHPDIILMQIPEHYVFNQDTISRIKRESKTTGIILVSPSSDNEMILRGIEYGVDGYVVGGVENGTLIEAVRIVHSGQKYFSESVRKIVFDDFYLKETPATKQEPKLNRALTIREGEILEHTVSGETNAQIAAALRISIKTVETHKANIREKLKLKNTVELVKYAIRNNIISI